MNHSDPDPRLNLKAAGSGKPVWYEDLRVIGILLILVGVLALPLVWFNKRMDVRKKVIISIVSVTIAAVFFVLSAWILDALDRRTDEVQASRQTVASQVKAVQTPAQPAALGS